MVNDPGCISCALSYSLVIGDAATAVAGAGAGADRRDLLMGRVPPWHMDALYRSV